ncbi:hypothetical protein JAAARDRAFT_142256 [Jaapia argillacea MUCL 33604]|uniref:Fido domain-containing protein n=1 Tax=Jaapia argillacea MUCL 33604 TaxID=933084 RepID=A0A067P5Q1_9AGAM|nr:hypothetical protein JAAARDRAFT_142256 [Jaapia argillacea MUCL 33604]
MQALNLVNHIAEDPSQLTAKFVRHLHTTCARSCRILPSHDRRSRESIGDISTRLTYANIGVSRATTQKNVQFTGPQAVQYCPFEDVDSELEHITSLAQQWIANWQRNPFAVSAWILLVLSSCCPFEVANGRISRLLASAPLVKSGLPPLCIPSSARVEYFTALSEVSRFLSMNPVLLTSLNVGCTGSKVRRLWSPDSSDFQLFAHCLGWSSGSVQLMY